jgi:hypothetical protein
MKRNSVMRSDDGIYIKKSFSHTDDSCFHKNLYKLHSETACKRDWRIYKKKHLAIQMMHASIRISANYTSRLHVKVTVS